MSPYTVQGDIDFDYPDDEELEETPQYVIDRLGFDPKELDGEDDEELTAALEGRLDAWETERKADTALQLLRNDAGERWITIGGKKGEEETPVAKPVGSSLKQLETQERTGKRMKLLSLHMPTPERITGYFRYGTRYFRFAVEKGKDPQIGQEFPSTEYGDIDTFGRMIKKQEPEVVIRKDLPLVPDLKFDTLFKYAEELTGKQHH